MRVLFVHQNFPGQFRSLAPALVRAGHEVVALRQGPISEAATRAAQQQGVVLLGWLSPRATTMAAHPWVHDHETKVIRGEAVAEACDRLRQRGWNPDLIVGHPGWGELLFLCHIWSSIPQLHFLEFHYAVEGLDVNFDPEFPQVPWHQRARVTAKVASSLIGLEQMTWGFSPTHFQASTYPVWAHPRISVIHDGIDTARVKPDPVARLQLQHGGPVLAPGDPVVTFVNRNLEPYRGYHRLMRALPEIQRRCPEAVVVLVGGDGVSYGAPAPAGGSWRQIFLDEVADDLDLSRVIFAGKVPYDTYLKLLQISACHVYFTYPFVLSWSCLEAMAAGALVVGSATAPVQEVIRHQETGLLVDFFDQDALVEAVSDVLLVPERYHTIREAARAAVVHHYDLATQCLPKQLRLVDFMLMGLPPMR